MSPTTHREHAVVLGAGMAGLLAARVLSEFYDSITLVERDRLPDHPCHRKGVPQGRHVHNFLSRGLQVLAELFPGLLEELAAAGAVVVDDGDLSHFYARFGPYELKRSGKLGDPAALALYMASRPFLEFHLRRRVKDLPNVTLLDGHDVVEPVAAADTVTGVRIAKRYKGCVTILSVAKAALNAAAHDTVLTERFFRVTHFIDPPGRLQDPALIPRILWGNLRARFPASEPERPWLRSPRRVLKPIRGSRFRCAASRAASPRPGTPTPATAGCSAADHTPSRSGRPGRCPKCLARHRDIR